MLERSNPHLSAGLVAWLRFVHLSEPFILSPSSHRPAMCLHHVSCFYLSWILWLENSSFRSLNQWLSTLCGKCCPGRYRRTRGKRVRAYRPRGAVVRGTSTHWERTDAQTHIERRHSESQAWRPLFVQPQTPAPLRGYVLRVKTLIDLSEFSYFYYIT